MKKMILSLVAVACAGTMAFAQPYNVDNAKNLPTATGMGFEFKFQGAPVDNCNVLTAGANNIWNTFGNGGYTFSFSGNNPVMMADGTGALCSIRLPEGNCANIVSNYIDCSSNLKIKMTVNSSAVVGKFSVMLAVDNGGFVAVDGFLGDARTTVSLPAGTDTTFTITSPSHDWTGTAHDMSKVLGMSFTVHDGTDVSTASNITIKSIQIGDAVTATAGITNSVDNSLIAVYPNPAKDQINIDLSSMNSSSASVKIMNSNGMVVYQGTASNSNEIVNTSSFNKGIYMVQVAAGNKISNKKLVIE